MRRHVVIVRDTRYIRSNDTWYDRYDQWYYHCERPTPIEIEVPIKWYYPMPPEPWSYWDIATISVNLEQLTRDIYDMMNDASASTSNREYAARLMKTLGELEDAAEDYEDAVYNGTDYIDSLNDLYWLESKVMLTEKTLDGYSKAYVVDREMKALHFYVEELLWTYRSNY